MKQFLCLVIMAGFCGMTPPPEIRATMYWNPFLSPSVTPMYFPQLNTNTVIVIASPQIPIGDIRFPDIRIDVRNSENHVNLSMDPYIQYSKLSGKSLSMLEAKHNYIIGKTENDILTGKISNGCRSVSRITIDAARVWLTRFCPVAETPPTLVACGVGVALQNAVVRKTAQQVMYKGCKVSVKYVSGKVLEVTIDTSNDLVKATEEAKFWMGYLNSIGGMVWLMNNIK